MSEPNVSYIGFFDMQVCVPKEYSDKQVEEFANTAHLCGTTKGWTIRRQEQYESDGCTDSLERVQCADHPENVHIMLDA